MAAAILSSTAMIIFYSYYIVYDIHEIDMHLRVSDHYGINADTDKLYFGRIPPGAAAERDIYLYHEYGAPLRVSIIASGKLAEWLVIPENNFLLPSNFNKTITLSVWPPEDTELGEYEGHLKILYKRI